MLKNIIFSKLKPYKYYVIKTLTERYFEIFLLKQSGKQLILTKVFECNIFKKLKHENRKRFYDKARFYDSRLF